MGVEPPESGGAICGDGGDQEIRDCEEEGNVGVGEGADYVGV